MAYFENEGFCPSCSSFTDYPADKRNQFIGAIISILNRRQILMVYELGRKSWFCQYPSIVDAMLGGDGVLGIQLATMLQNATPDFQFHANKGIRKIRLVDCLCPADLGKDVYYDQYGRDCNWSFYVDGKVVFDEPVHRVGNRTIIHDDRYAIVVCDIPDGDIEVRLLAIPTV